MRVNPENAPSTAIDTRELLSQAVVSSWLSAGAVVATFLVFSLSDAISPYLVSWLVIALTVALSRATLLGYLHRRHRRDSTMREINVHYWSGLASALSWGLLAFTPPADLPPAIQGLAWGVPILVAATAMSTYSIVIRHYRDYLLVLTLCVLAGILYHQGDQPVAAAVAYALFSPVIYATGKRYHQSLADNRVASQKVQQMLQEVRQLDDELHAKSTLIDQEEAIANHVFAALTRYSEQNIPGIQSWNQPMGSLSGDLVQVAQGPQGEHYIFLGDFTGHGLPAALGAVPTSAAFNAMTQKGLPVSTIAAELNSKLHELLPTGYFCCAIVMALSPDRSRVTIWNGGLPPLLVRQAGSGKITRVPARNLPLGVVGKAEFLDDCSERELQFGDRLYAYTDGLIEAQNCRGEMWGHKRLVDLLSRDSGTESRIMTLKLELHEFSYRAAPTDDITIIEIEAETLQPSLAKEA